MQDRYHKRKAVLEILHRINNDEDTGNYILGSVLSNWATEIVDIFDDKDVLVKQYDQCPECERKLYANWDGWLSCQNESCKLFEKTLGHADTGVRMSAKVKDEYELSKNVFQRGLVFDANDKIMGYLGMDYRLVELPGSYPTNKVELLEWAKALQVEELKEDKSL